MKFWTLLIIGAVLPFLFDEVLPRGTCLWFLLLIAAAALRFGHRYCFIAPAVFLITSLTINYHLDQRLLSTGDRPELLLHGVIASLPQSRGDVTRFAFLPDEQIPGIPERLLVSWYHRASNQENIDKAEPSIRAGEKWQLYLELRSTKSKINFNGFDAEQWYFTTGVGALAIVQDGANVRLATASKWNLQHWRQSVLDKLRERAGGVSMFRLLAALAIADRRGMYKNDRDILSATGTGHLLAISGLHIGLAAAMGFYLGKLGLLIGPYGFSQRFAIYLPWLVAWLTALIYSALAGFGVSTQRALIMLTVASVTVLARRNVHPMLAWLIAMALVLLLDPLAPLRAGFWFSFTAVAILLMIFVPRQGYVPAWKRMLLAQIGISMVMAPLGMYWFQQASLPGLLANLVAIPVVSMLVVPLILVALPLLWVAGPWAEYLLGGAGLLTQWLMAFLELMARLQPAVFSGTAAPGLMATLLAILGAAITLLPRGVPGRPMGLLLILPLLFPIKFQTNAFQMQLDMLDVGQGLAVLLTGSDYQLLYDTGPGNGQLDETGWDLVSGTILPAIKASGTSPNMVVASHADLDHAGGLNRLYLTYPDADFMASLPSARPGIRICESQMAWSAGSLAFKVLHPSAGLPYLGNDSSCVISVQGSGPSVLLSGDISHVIEQRLLAEGLNGHDILTVPHHGSATSSSQALISKVQPRLALVSAGMNNRFGFPRQAVLERYSSSRIPVLNTALCGGIRVTVDPDGKMEMELARQARQAMWRWPADKDCLQGLDNIR